MIKPFTNLVKIMLKSARVLLSQYAKWDFKSKSGLGMTSQPRVPSLNVMLRRKANRKNGYISILSQ